MQRFFNRPASLMLWIALWLAIAGAMAGERGLLWKIEAPDTPPSYLFGTIHTDDARVTDFSPQVRAALREAAGFMMETLPPRDLSAIFMTDSLAGLLQQHELARLRELAQQYALGEEKVLRMKPWLLAIVFSLPRLQSPFAQDYLLMNMAYDHGLQLYSLEETAEHLGALDDLPMPQQLELLRAALVQPQMKKEEAYERVVQAYLSRELEQILKVEDELALDRVSAKLWASVKSRLLDRRNAVMAERIAAQVRQGPVFVAVGAAHLPGEKGLINLLRRAGFSVQAVE